LSLEILNTLPDHAAAAWRCYRGFLNQVVLNLFTNAERYAYPGGVCGRIEILVGENSERVTNRSSRFNQRPERKPRSDSSFHGRSRSELGHAS
jgi:hypothetical protein